MLAPSADTRVLDAGRAPLQCHMDAALPALAALLAGPAAAAAEIKTEAALLLSRLLQQGKVVAVEVGEDVATGRCRARRPQSA